MIRWSTFSAQSSFASSSLSSSSYLPYPNLSDSSQVVYLYHHLFILSQFLFLIISGGECEERLYLYHHGFILSNFLFLIIRWCMWGAMWRNWSRFELYISHFTSCLTIRHLSSLCWSCQLIIISLYHDHNYHSKLGWDDCLLPAGAFPPCVNSPYSLACPRQVSTFIFINQSSQFTIYCCYIDQFSVNSWSSQASSCE